MGRGRKVNRYTMYEGRKVRRGGKEDGKVVKEQWERRRKPAGR